MKLVAGRINETEEERETREIIILSNVYTYISLSHVMS